MYLVYTDIYILCTHLYINFTFIHIFASTPTRWCGEFFVTVGRISCQVAVAFAAAKRGTGERERLVANESSVEEFIVRRRRVLVKRDDKVRVYDV